MLVLMALLALPVLWPRAGAQTLIIDLTTHLIGVSSAFTGGKVVVFGTTEGQQDLAVVVRGPVRDATVWRKRSVGGIWVNADSVRFDRVPSFYAAAVTDGFLDQVSSRLLTRNGIGLSGVRLVPSDPDADEAKVEVFSNALIRQRVEAGLFQPTFGEVVFLGDRLFRSSLLFPANVPTGSYQVTVYLIEDGDVIAAETTPLAISKSGFSAAIFEFANFNALAYAIIAVIGAVIAGWIPSIIFRRG
jgi:uncharacterized protein (TIGR02186 family)